MSETPEKAMAILAGAAKAYAALDLVNTMLELLEQRQREYNGARDAYDSAMIGIGNRAALRIHEFLYAFQHNMQDQPDESYEDDYDDYDD